MKAAQFVKGKIDGIQKDFITANLYKVLPKDKIGALTNYTEIGEYSQFFKTEKVLTRTVVTEAENTDGRHGGVVNHTVLYQWNSTLTYEDAPYIFDLETFINEILAGKRRFKMPPQPTLPNTDFAIIEEPPAIEWEVNPDAV